MPEESNPPVNENKIPNGKFEKLLYFPGRLLTAKDFTLEQNYFDGKRSLINKYLHGVGVVCGLKIKDPPTKSGDSWRVTVSAGLGLDCIGREIYLRNDKELTIVGDIPAPDEKKGIFIRRKDLQTDPVPTLSESCGCSESCCDSKIVEDYELFFDDLGETNPSDKDANCFKILNNADLGIDFSNISQDSIRRIAQGFRSQVDCPTCDENQPKVLLGVVTGVDENSLELDIETTKSFQDLVYTNLMIFNILSCHLLNSENPHNVTAEQLRAIMRFGIGDEKIGNLENSSDRVPEIKLDAIDPITLEPLSPDTIRIGLDVDQLDIKASKISTGLLFIDHRTNNETIYGIFDHHLEGLKSPPGIILGRSSNSDMVEFIGEFNQCKNNPDLCIRPVNVTKTQFHVMVDSKNSNVARDMTLRWWAVGASADFNEPVQTGEIINPNEPTREPEIKTDLEAYNLNNNIIIQLTNPLTELDPDRIDNLNNQKIKIISDGEKLSNNAVDFRETGTNTQILQGVLKITGPKISEKLEESGGSFLANLRYDYDTRNNKSVKSNSFKIVREQQNPFTISINKNNIRLRDSFTLKIVHPARNDPTGQRFTESISVRSITNAKITTLRLEFKETSPIGGQFASETSFAENEQMIRLLRETQSVKVKFVYTFENKPVETEFITVKR